MMKGPKPGWVARAEELGAIHRTRQLMEDVEDPLMRRIRYLDKLIDELAQGKAMARILRQ